MGFSGRVGLGVCKVVGCGGSGFRVWGFRFWGWGFEGFGGVKGLTI